MPNQALQYPDRTVVQQWIRRFILFHDKRHPLKMGAPEVEAFLTYLAVKRNVAASTQNQALAALLFLYRNVLEIDLPWLDNVTRAKTSTRLPVVMTAEEVRLVLAQLDGVHHCVASLMYGSGLRLMEAIRLRVKDVDFSRKEIIVRDGKGGKDRRTMLPTSLNQALLHQLDRVRTFHEQDLLAGVSPVYLPYALEPMCIQLLLEPLQRGVFCSRKYTYMSPLAINPLPLEFSVLHLSAALKCPVFGMQIYNK